MCKSQCQQCGQELVAPKSFKCAFCGCENLRVVCREPKPPFQKIDKLSISELRDN